MDDLESRSYSENILDERDLLSSLIEVVSTDELRRAVMGLKGLAADHFMSRLLKVSFSHFIYLVLH